MKKKWLAAFTACFALTLACGLASCGGCSSCGGNSQSQSSGEETQSSSVIKSSEEIVESSSIVEGGEAEVSSEAEESGEAEVSSEEIVSSETIESSEVEVSSEVVESSEAEESSESLEGSATQSTENVESSAIEASSEVEESLPEESSETEESLPEESSEIIESSEESIESSSSEEENEGRTDEEIFAEIKAAVLATQSYNGGFTMVFREDMHNGEFLEEGWLTINPETLEMASYGTEDNEDLSIEKSFIKDGKYYIYGVYGEVDDLTLSDVNCQETTAYRVQNYLTDISNHYAPSALLNACGTFAIADTYAELCESFEFVSQASINKMVAEGYVNAMGNYMIDVGFEDGISWITFVVNSVCGEFPDDSINNYQAQMSYTFVVENGYVTQVIENYHMSYDSEWGLETNDVTVVYTYAYAFDQELYDSIEPCAPQVRDEYDLIVKLHLHPDYIVEEYVTITAESTAENILGQLNHVFWGIPEDLDLVIDGWYLDEACTIKFDPTTITDLMEYERITDLYAKSVSFNSNYAWVIVEDSYEKHYSKPYQITEMFEKNGRSDRWVEPFCLVSEPYYLPNADKVLVDSVETTAESITLEGGKTYVVTCVEYAQDGDHWLYP